ncbi:MAG: hypothetical protein WAK04_04135 [Xanthobacteraceae bacterium]
MATDPFDLKNLRLPPEQVAELAPLQKKQSKSRSGASGVEFVMLPYEQTLAAAGRARNAQLAVLVELAHRRFATHENPVLLTNKILEAVGINRWAKYEALFGLETAGLVSVTWQNGKSPLVTLLWD